MKLVDKEIVICAAIKTKGGKVIRGHRHNNCLETMRHMGMGGLARVSAEQGFVTSRNRFVSREEGRKLQDAAGIKSIAKYGYVKDTLFSEDLY